MITCIECNIQYIGCTSNALKIRIRRHLSDISNPNMVNVSAASKHFISEHDRNPAGFRFAGIEKVHMPSRGGDRKKKLFKRESYWIFSLDTRAPRVMNTRQDLRLQL